MCYLKGAGVERDDRRGATLAPLQLKMIFVLVELQT